MQGSPTSAYTSDHVVHPDGSVTFSCSQDGERWPWSTLHPHHPGTIQSLSYWASVESAMALGSWDPEKWSALTWTRWRCGDPDVGRIAKGKYRRCTIEGRESFTIDLLDADDRFVCQLDGRGVVFRTRDFEKWRKSDKDAAARAPSDSFDFADETLLSLTPGERPLLGPLRGDVATALVDKANGMPPGHPWLDGSGDHVNSAHLAEVARQFVSLIHGGGPFRIPSAEMRFDHYVELGSPFEIRRLESTDNDAVRMLVRQRDRDCTLIDFRLTLKSV